MAWRSDYSMPGNSPLTGMGQRSVSASNLAALGNLPPDFLTSQAHCKSLSQPTIAPAIPLCMSWTSEWSPGSAALARGLLSATCSCCCH